MAKADLKEASSNAPNFTEAVFLLAQLNIQTGAVQPAIEDLERLVALQPRVFQAHALLGPAYLAKLQPAKATEAFRNLMTLAPKDPSGPSLVGIGLRAQGKDVEAKKEFQAALALAPGYVEPLAQRVDMAFREKQPDGALNLITKQIAAAPKSGGLQHLLAGTETSIREEAVAPSRPGVPVDTRLPA